MKFKFVYPLFALALGAFLFLSNSNGRASSQNEGNTGAPGDNALNGRTCQTCHNGGPLQVTLDIEVSKNGNPVTSYVPGENYDVKVVINDAAGSPSAYGFQMVAEINADNSSTNSWSNPSGNAKTASTSDGRSYVEQDGASNSNEFSATWTAPASGSGDVTFYSCGNGVNANGMTSGDGAACNNITLSEDTESSILEASTDATRMLLQPNPVISDFQVLTHSNTNGNFELSILTLDGKQLSQQNVVISNGRSSSVMVSNLSPGYYLVKVQDEQTTMVSKMLKW